MDSEPAQGLRPIAKKFGDDLGIKVTIETPVNIVDNFPLAAQAGQGPDIVIWAHDKVGEWADSGLIAPVKLSSELVRKLYPQAWEAVRHHEAAWGYPIALETITLIYNKKLLVGSAPTDLSQLVSINQLIQTEHPGARTILWALISSYEKLAPSDIRLRQLKVAVDLGQVMPNIPQMGRFFSAVGTALQIATDGQGSAGEALREAAMNM